MRKLTGLILALSLSSTPLWAVPLDFGTSFDNAPWIGARAAALGQALSPNANGLDAFYYNPALIGGLREKSDKPYLTHLFVPYIGNASEDGSNKILTQQLGGEKLQSDEVWSQLSPAWNGDRPYTALSLTPVFIFNRLMAGYTYKSRTNAYRDDEDPAGSKLHVESRMMSGPFLGFSAVAPKQDFYLGVSAAYLKTSTMDADFDQAAWASEATRKAVFDTGKMSYEGMPINIGTHYRFQNLLRPSISAVINDMGGTRYSPSDKSKDTQIQEERLTLGLGISPQIKSAGTLHVTVEATNLAQHAVPSRDKIRASTEFTFGDRYGADSGGSLRLGYTSAGVSYGAGVNMGILAIQMASFAEDIGAKTDRVIQRKSVINIGINIADY
ncbi:MAG: hypothetical protein H7318_13450 [Oligoflexus sp.]|nr:hypothetical protein [Oligoflexus sp.]